MSLPIELLDTKMCDVPDGSYFYMACGCKYRKGEAANSGFWVYRIKGCKVCGCSDEPFALAYFYFMVHVDPFENALMESFHGTR